MIVFYMNTKSVAMELIHIHNKNRLLIICITFCEYFIVNLCKQLFENHLRLVSKLPKIWQYRVPKMYFIIIIYIVLIYMYIFIYIDADYTGKERLNTRHMYILQFQQTLLKTKIQFRIHSFLKYKHLM